MWLMRMDVLSHILMNAQGRRGKIPIAGTQVNAVTPANRATSKDHVTTVKDHGHRLIIQDVAATTIKMLVVVTRMLQVARTTNETAALMGTPLQNPTQKHNHENTSHTFFSSIIAPHGLQ